jgi:hypothetical protein
VTALLFPYTTVHEDPKMHSGTVFTKVTLRRIILSLNNEYP